MKNPRETSLDRAAGRGGRRSWTSAAAIALVPALLVVLAFVNPGVKVSQVDLNDGSVWLTAQNKQRLGRFNAQIQELNGGVVPSQQSFDVLQSGSDVLLVEPDSVTVVDPAALVLGTTVELPAGAVVAMGGGSVAVTTPDGQVWATTFRALDSFAVGGDAPPALTLGAGAVTAVARDGSVLAFDPATGKVHRGTADGPVMTFVEDETLEDAAGITPTAAAAVGDALVVLAGGRVHSKSWVADVAGYGDVVLQQSGPSHEHVLLGAASGLLRVAMSGGAVEHVPTGGSGTAAAPVVVAGCEYGAWSSPSGSYLQACAGAEPRVEALPDVSASTPLVFRVNRNVVALNDTAEGMVWLPADVPQMHRPNWDDIDSDDDDQDQQETTDDVQTTSNLLEECKDQTSTPQPKDDDYGVRAGRTTILQVLNNDVAVECGVMTITEVTGLPESFGTVESIYGGRALQLRVAPGAQGTASFTYAVSDGRGLDAPQTATVTLTLRGAQQNDAPVQDRAPTVTVEAGASVRVDVLGTFTDPDSDDLQLVGATIAKGTGQVRTRLDGMMTFTAQNDDLGRQTVKVTVSDGELTGEGTVYVDVRPPGTLPPVVEPLHRTALVDETIVVDVLAAVRSVSREPVRFGGADAVEGAQITSDQDAGTFTFSAATPRTYYVPLAVTAGSQAAVGLARIDVLPRPEEVGPPVAVRDVALLPDGGEVTIDPLANDSDPSSLVLVLVSATAPEGSPLHLGVINHRLLRLSSDRTLTRPTTVEYVVSNGVHTARGEILVMPTTPSATQRPPVVPDLTASVRTDGVVTVPALEDAHDPDGDELTLLPEIAQAPERGLLFVSGDKLRYQASSVVGTATAVFQVADSAGNVTSAKLTVKIHPSDRTSKQPPRPQDLVARVFDGETVRIPVPLVGIDPDGDGVQLLGQATAPAKGRIVAVGPDYLEYEAFPDERGSDTFTYAVEDWVGQRAVATVQVGIAARPSEPQPIVARDDSVTVQPGERVEVRVLANDVDPAGGVLSIVEPFTAPEGVDATVSDRRIIVQTPTEEGVLQIPYEVQNAIGGRAGALLTVVVSKDATVLPPVAGDVVVPATETLSKTSVDVDVLAVAENPSGPLTDLAVSVPASHAAYAQVNAANKVTVTLGPTSRTIPYLLTNTRPEAGGVSSYAFITVPALGDFPPVLRPKARELRVAAGSEITIDLDEFVQVGPGRSPRLTSADRVSATKSDGSELVVDEKTLRYAPQASYAGPASITFEVSDGAANDTSARLKTLTLPITVYATEDYPPQFLPPVLEIAQGGQPVSLDLRAVTRGPQGADPDVDGYTYQLTSGAPAGFQATLSGTVLTISAAATTQRGTVGNVGIRLGYGAAGVLDGRVEFRAVASDRQRPRVQDFTVEGRPGVASEVDVLAGAFNPFAPAPLRIVGAEVISGEGVATASTTRVTATPARSFVGDLRVRFRVHDDTGDASREAEGIVTVKVVDVPDTPAAPSVTEDGGRKVTVSWVAPVQNGAPIDQYQVRYGSEETAAFAGTTRTFELDYDKDYTFSVRAHNAAGWSEYSPVSRTVRLDVAPEAPAAPTLAFGDRSLDVSWREPRSEGSPVRGYRVELSGGPTGTVPVVVDVAGTSRRFDGLVNGAEYRVRVLALNSAAAEGPWSDYSRETPATVPAAPVVTATRTDTPLGGEIRVTWDRKIENGGAPVTGFTVTATGPNGRTAQLEATAESYVFDRAENGASYTFSVTASNKAGTGRAGTTTARTWGTPSAPTGGSSAQTNATGAPFGKGEVQYTWQPPSSTGGTGIAVKAYEVTVGGDTVRTEAPSFTLRNLAGSASEPSPAIRVRACTEPARGVEVCSPSSSALSVSGAAVVTVPQQPTISITSSRPGRYSYTVTPGDDGGSGVTGVQVCRTEISIVNTRSTTCGDGLTGSGSSRRVEITAVATNAAGSSTQAAESLDTNTRAPDAPEDLVVTATLTETGWTATATWNAPDEDGGSAVTGYVVLCGSAPAVHQSADTTAQCLLTTEDSVTVSVSAVNAMGQSAPATRSVDRPPPPPTQEDE